MAYIAAAESSGKVPANATSFFNHSGRAYPDLAAVATPYNVYCDGFVNVGTGTSASTPTVSAIIAFLNQHRLAANKSSLGFLNPLIYKVLGPSGAFRDIVDGFSPGMRDRPGFYAMPGWDAASGWGTPNFTKLLAEVMALP